ncbi:hypothetical protein [Paracoccus aerodenitrificans]|nr:hypothetical protein [Paracoccus aerodenitrificans]
MNRLLHLTYVQGKKNRLVITAIKTVITNPVICRGAALQEAG